LAAQYNSLLDYSEIDSLITIFLFGILSFIFLFTSLWISKFAKWKKILAIVFWSVSAFTLVSTISAWKFQQNTDLQVYFAKEDPEFLGRLLSMHGIIRGSICTIILCMLGLFLYRKSK
jgi:hypothetical protein